MTCLEIFTERLRLTPLVATDAQRLFAYRSDPEIWQYQSWAPSTIDQVHQFIANLEPIFDTPGTWFQLAIRDRKTDALIGDAGVHFHEHDATQVEIGFTVAPTHQRQGFATEAVNALLDHLFVTMKKDQVTASVDPRNTASIAVLKRIGMRQSSHVQNRILLRGEWVDDLAFEIERDR